MKNIMIKHIRSNKSLNRISTRITVLLAIILLVSFGAFIGFTIYYGEEQSRRNLIDYTRFLATSLGRVLRIDMLENQRQNIAFSIQELGKDPDIRNLTIYAHKGVVAYSSSPERVGEKKVKSERPCILCHQPGQRAVEKAIMEPQISRKQVQLFIPVYNEIQCSSKACHAHSPDEKVLGILEIQVSSEKLIAQLRTTRNIMIGLGIAIILGTALIVFFLLWRWIWQPVQSILEGTKRIAAGNLDEPIPVGRAELGELAKAFNSMQSQLKDTQRHLLMCEKLASIGKLAAGVAHEINNPLTGILTFSESLLEETPPDHPHRHDYEVIHRQSLRSRDIVRKILDFARQDEPVTRFAQINKIVENTVGLVKRLTQFKNIQIVTNFQPTLPEILVDPGQIEQVIMNMLINSSEAITGGGRITIETEADPNRNEVCIKIADNGAGIPPENLTKIFDPFFSTKKNSKSSNSGLGLSVSWGIIEQHGGRIDVESQVGVGTTFRIYLPMRTQ